MNPRAAIISLVLVLLLAGAAAYLLRPAPLPPGPAPTWLSSLDTAPVEKLEFRRGGDTMAEVVRRDGAWFVHVPDGSRPDWPVEDTRVRGLMRLLAGVAATPATTATGEFGQSLTIVAAPDVRRVLSAEASPVGGRGTLITRDDPAGTNLARTIDASLASSLGYATVVSTWPRLAAFPSEPMTVSRVRVESGGLLLEIARVRNAWNLLLPFPSPGAPEPCNSLAATLAQLPAERLIGKPDAHAATWTSSPTTLFEIESSKPGDEARRLVQELRIGGAADGAGMTLIAQAQAHWIDAATNAKTLAWGPMVLTVNRSLVEAIHPDLAAFAARESLQTPLADIAGIWLGPCGSPDALHPERSLTPPRKDALPASEFAGVHFARSIDGWKKVTVGTTGAILNDTESTLLNSLLKTLCESPAAGITAEQPKDAACLSAIVLTDSSGSPLAMVGLGQVPGGAGGPGLVVRSGRLWRLYIAKDAGAIAGWIADLHAATQTP